MDMRKEINAIFEAQVFSAIQRFDAWQYKMFERALASKSVAEFQAWLRENLNERQLRCFGGNEVWRDLPTPIGDFADLEDICTLIIDQLPETHVLFKEWHQWT